MLQTNGREKKMEDNWDENASRVPERNDYCRGYEQGINLYFEEYYRFQNHDESKVRKYQLPPLPDTLEEWERQRPTILQQFKDCVYGVMPPAPDHLEVKLLASRDDALGGIALRREYRVYCSMDNGKKFDFDILLYVPKNAKTPPPVFVHLNFSGNQINTPDDDIRPTRAPGQDPGRWHADSPNKQKRGLDLFRTNYIETIKRGYASCTACYGEIFPDNLDGFRKSLFRLFYDDLRPDCEITLPELQAGRRRNFGAYGGWAWGYSRIADALEKIDLVDATKLACVGHSRLAVASLWAGVNDERFKLVVSNNAGKGGPQYFRRDFGSLPSIFILRSNWVTDNFQQYIPRIDELPVDQHQLLALVAPRALYVTSSSKDFNADPYGAFLSTREASKIWRLYGEKGLDPNCEMPPLHTPIGGKIRYHVKEGKHSIREYDWEQYYNAADELFGKPN